LTFARQGVSKGIMMKRLMSQAWMQEIIAFLVFFYIETVRRSIRWEVRNGDFIQKVHAENIPIIGAIWHGRILMALQGWDRDRDRMMAVASRSRDADLGMRLVRWYNVKLARGSSHNKDKPGQQKGGSGAYREVMRHIEAGGSGAITPDGPRGPRMRASFGAVRLARDTGAPIIPFTWSTKRKLIVRRSWDRHYLPAYFTRGVIVWGDPIYVAKDASQAELEAARDLLEERMNAISLEADEAAGGESIAPDDNLRPVNAPDGAAI